MPELPEVETIRQGLAQKATGKKIARVIVRKPKIIRESARVFTKFLQGASFSDVRRHGKLLILPLSSKEKFLLVHLKMTGQLIYQDATSIIAGGHQWPPVSEDDLPNKYTHVQFDFSDGSRLYFNDLRQFGFMALVNQSGLDTYFAGKGIDPINQTLSYEDFANVIAGRKASIKAVLLNQALIAGIGNIYADEICFAAKVRPQRRANTLTEKELRAIWRSIPAVLYKALTYGGTTFRNFRDSEGGKGNFTRLLKVYGRGGQRCRRCKEGIIRKIVVAQRGTHFCPRCQK